MSARNHLHTYKRSKLNKNYFQCSDPECTHYIRRELIVGKKARCTCGEEYILDSDILRRANPRCSSCGNRKADKDRQSAIRAIDQVLTEAITEEIANEDK
jgi:hypothetical protein